MKWGIEAMKSKTSFINMGILLNDLKRFAWIGAGYLLVLLLSVPLKIFMLYSRDEEPRIINASDYLRVFQFDPNTSFLQVLMLIVVPVLTGLLLFRYLQDSRAADMAHTLPVKRETLYNTHVVTGIVFLFLPLILTALVSWALVAGLGLEDVNGADILTWLSNSLLISLLFFVCCVAVGMITGMTTLQGVLSIIVLLLPSGLSMLLLHNLNQYIYGFAYEYYLPQVEKLSPLIRLTEISRNPYGTGEIVLYLISSIVLYFVGRSLYSRRHIETAGSAITFGALRPFFKYSVTFCSMLLTGSYFNQVQDSMAWTYFGYLLGSLLAYFLIEILLHKSLQVFRWQQLKGYGIYALAMAVLLGLFHFDCMGYEKKLPLLSEVKSVYMDNSFYPLTNVPANVPAANALVTEEWYQYTPVKAIFTDKNSIARIYSLHEQIIANRLDKKASSLPKSTRNTERICLAYELENGKNIYRQYVITTPAYADSLKPIYESREYKELHNEILRVNPAEVDFIEINGTVDRPNKNLRIVDPELIAQAVAALQSDIYDETYEEMVNINGKIPWAQVHIQVKNRSFSQDWKKSHVNFEQWLKDTGKHDQVRVLPGADIACAFIDRAPDINEADSGRPQSKTSQPAINIEALEKNPGVLKITDPEKLEWCLRHYYGNSEQAAYQVVFVRNDGGTFTGFLSANLASSLF
ncbi:MAG: ABC-2 family transporter protein [Pelotomaculum sp. PtaB.Bin104]|nr:MAG: ABC-2 family transporter protein [Pelotomaculum sp. PtaB.Bin104]